MVILEVPFCDLFLSLLIFVLVFHIKLKRGCISDQIQKHVNWKDITTGLMRKLNNKQEEDNNFIVQVGCIFSAQKQRIRLFLGHGLTFKI